MPWAVLSIIGKLHLEFLAGKEDTALDGAQREVHLLGDLVVLVTGNVHREGDAVLIGKCVDGIRNLTGSERTFGSLKA